MAFWSMFEAECSELQRTLAARNGAVDEAATSLPVSEEDKKVLAHEDFMSMLATNEPPATRFVVQRARAITECAIKITVPLGQLNAAADESKFSHCCMTLLTLGCAPVSRAVLMECADSLCDVLENACATDSAFVAGDAGAVLAGPLDAAAFAAECDAFVNNARRQRRNTTVTLPMHAAQILSACLRATCAADATLVASESSRSLQWSGSKSVSLETFRAKVAESSPRIGKAVAGALGVVKASVRLADDIVHCAPGCATALCAALKEYVASPLCRPSFAEAWKQNARLTAMLELLESLAVTAGPGTREADFMISLFDEVLASGDALQHLLGNLFSNYEADTGASSTMRATVVRAFGVVTSRTSKWYARFCAGKITPVATTIVRTTKHPAFRAALAKGRREDQLRCVSLLNLGVHCVKKIVVGPRAEIDGAPVTDFGAVRELLPDATVLCSLLPLVEENPHTTILHSTIANLFDGIASLSNVGGLSPNVSISDATAGRVELAEATLSAVAGCIIFDETKCHLAAVNFSQHTALQSFAALLATISLNVVLSFGDSADAQVAEYQRLVSSLAGQAIRCALNSETERDFSSSEQLRRFCIAATQRTTDMELSVAANSLNFRPTVRVVVDEVDTLEGSDSQHQRPPQSPSNVALPIVTVTSSTVSAAAPAIAAPAVNSPPASASPSSPDLRSPPSGASFETSEASLTSQGSLASQGSRKFGIKRRANASASPSFASPMAGLVSPTHGANAPPSMLPVPNVSDEGNQLSLTSSLNESCHSGFDRGASYEHRSLDVDEGAPLALPRRQPTRRTAANTEPDLFATDAFSTTPPLAPTQKAHPPESTAATAPDLFASWNASK